MHRTRALRYAACFANSAFIAGHPLEAGGSAAAAASVAIVLDLLGTEPAGEAAERAGGGSEGTSGGGEGRGG